MFAACVETPAWNQKTSSSMQPPWLSDLTIQLPPSNNPYLTSCELYMKYIHIQWRPHGSRPTFEIKLIVSGVKNKYSHNSVNVSPRAHAYIHKFTHTYTHKPTGSKITNKRSICTEVARMKTQHCKIFSQVDEFQNWIETAVYYHC
jgi:hypothetical protein